MSVPVADYLERGWAVLPVVGKRPHPMLAPRGVYSATKDRDRVLAWAQTPIAVATGPVSNVVVLDVDIPASLAGLPPLTATAMVATPRGGLHFYYASDAPIGNSAGRLGPGLDVRGDGGYVVAPNSPGYQWVDEREPAPLPGWLAERLAVGGVLRTKAEAHPSVAGGSSPGVYVYVLRCADDSLYVGITNDITSRMREHYAGVGSNYTAPRRPLRPIRCWLLAEATHEEARKVEDILTIVAAQGSQLLTTTLVAALATPRKAYEVDPGAIPPPPGTDGPLLLPAGRPPPRSPWAPAPTKATPKGRRALSYQWRKVAAAVEGTRNSTLHMAAYSLAPLVAYGDIAEEYLFKQLLGAAIRAGLDDKEAAKTIESGLRAGMSTPRVGG